MITSFQIIIGAWIAFWVFLYVPLLFRRVPTRRRSSKYVMQTGMLAVIAWMLLALLEWYRPGSLFLRILPDSPLAGITGVILTVAGLGFSAYSRIYLGKNWSNMPAIKVGQQLIRTGPYRFVRNPMYTGILVALAGAVIATNVLLAFLLFGVFVIAIWLKIKAEEEILLETFGEEFLRYKKDVKVALIPFVV
jgi:protein-S-isoprenylcysteine O-methyltransferase Ste14